MQDKDEKVEFAGGGGGCRMQSIELEQDKDLYTDQGHMKDFSYIKSCAILLHQESIILPQSGWPTFKIHQPPLMVQNIHIYTFNLWFEK